MPKQPPFRVDASKPYAASVNRELAAADGETFQELYNGMRTSYNDDPLVGSTIPDTTVTWNASTEPQSLIAVAYSELGLDRSTLQAELDANKGPVDPRYLSYEQWGLVPGVAPDPTVQEEDVIVVATGARVRGLRIPEGW